MIKCKEYHTWFSYPKWMKSRIKSYEEAIEDIKNDVPVIHTDEYKFIPSLLLKNKGYTLIIHVDEIRETIIKPE